MGRYARKRDGSGEVAAAAKRRRKTASGGSEESTSSAELKTRRSDAPANSCDSSCENVDISGSALASCCSSSGLSEPADMSPEFADLEKNAVVVKFCATSSEHTAEFRDRRENPPPREAQTESGELESPPHASDSVGIPTAEIIPTEAELDEFFSAAEQNIRQQFIQKYNYDIAKDEPLEGRYEWNPSRAEGNQTNLKLIIN
ncbi:Cyclin-dependent kinase inhibitor 7 [Striga hermonthica]|uniref:Cyclin-dependent kinase inhibitor n=1 Tax=Striga hermonthica TaxID=68872 RepID=A0A9N7NX19_STRHE|nr:Cyclin-dependent kinase inhibitor 7 [Striga hermonthica]